MNLLFNQASSPASFNLFASDDGGGGQSLGLSPVIQKIYGCENVMLNFRALQDQLWDNMNFLCQ